MLTNFLTSTVTKSNLSALKSLQGEIGQWIQTNGAEWAKKKRQWGNVVEDASCPVSATAAAQTIYNVLK